jgi:hypothetical protein
VPLKGNKIWEEFMALLEAAMIIFNAAVWLITVAVAGLFVFGLVCETIESIRDHNRRAARVAAGAPTVRSISGEWIRTCLFRRPRHSLNF